MILTIWRHGQAANAAQDIDRELTETGLDDISFGCDQFHQQCEMRRLALPEIILHSRWLRTAQTADIIGRQFSQAVLESAEALVPGSRIGDVSAMLDPLLEGGVEHAILVSHQPLVSALIDHYLGDPGRVAALVPGGFAMLRLDIAMAGTAELVFSAQPPEYRAQA